MLIYIYNMYIYIYIYMLYLPGESHGGRSLVGYSPQGHKELDVTEST